MLYKIQVITTLPILRFFWPVFDVAIVLLKDDFFSEVLQTIFFVQSRLRWDSVFKVDAMHPPFFFSPEIGRLWRSARSACPACGDWLTEKPVAW